MKRNQRRAQVLAKLAPPDAPGSPGKVEPPEAPARKEDELDRLIGELARGSRNQVKKSNITILF